MVNYDYIVKIENRNDTILESADKSAVIRSEFNGYYTGLFEYMWHYTKMSGIRERGGIVEIPVN